MLDPLQLIIDAFHLVISDPKGTTITRTIGEGILTNSFQYLQYGDITTTSRYSHFLYKIENKYYAR